MQIIGIGQPFPVSPPGEGFIAMFRGATFDAVAFLSRLRPAEIEAFRTGDLSYGLFVHGDVPVFLVDIAGFGNTDLTLNIAVESADTREAFFGDEANLINLILCDYPSGIVRGLRSIGIDYPTMREIKRVCQRQKLRRKVERQIQQVYQRHTTADMIAQTDMKRLSEQRD